MPAGRRQDAHRFVKHLTNSRVRDSARRAFEVARAHRCIRVDICPNTRLELGFRVHRRPRAHDAREFREAP